MNHLEYLASYGSAGDFGRFRAIHPLVCQRGDLVVVRSHRGLELGRILRPATPRHAVFLPNTSIGQLLRRANPEDEQFAQRLRERAGELFERARHLVVELELPLEIVDAEVLLDEAHGVLQQIRWGDGDVRPMVSTLSREFGLHILLTDLAGPVPEPEEAAAGCGSCGEGGCGSGGCGTGGCSTGQCGSCGSGGEETKAYFAELREKMERRVPLL